MFGHIFYHIHSDHGSHYSEQVILAPTLHIIQQTKTTTELLKLIGPHLSRTKLSMLSDISHRLSPSDSSKYSFSPPNREKAELSSSRLPKSHDTSMTYDVWAIFTVCLSNWPVDTLLKLTQVIEPNLYPGSSFLILILWALFSQF